jgi:hypothetical protein
MCETKICSTCNKEKEVVYFTKNKRSKDGFDYMCKICRKERYGYQTLTEEKKQQKRENAKKYYDVRETPEYKEKMKVYLKERYERRKQVEYSELPKMMTCIKCNEELPIKCFSKAPGMSFNISNICKSCQKEWRLNNPEKVKAHARNAWQARKNKRASNIDFKEKDMERQAKNSKNHYEKARDTLTDEYVSKRIVELRLFKRIGLRRKSITKDWINMYRTNLRLQRALREVK